MAKKGSFKNDEIEFGSNPDEEKVYRNQYVEIDDDVDSEEGVGVHSIDNNETEPMGTFIEYTISNKLNQASQGTTKERIWAYKDILILLAPFLDDIKEFDAIMPMKTALDELMKQAQFKFGKSYKRLMFIRSNTHTKYAEDKYLHDLENLAMRAMRLAHKKDIINLERSSSGYNMVLFDQGGGFRPQPKRLF